LRKIPGIEIYAGSYCNRNNQPNGNGWNLSHLVPVIHIQLKPFAENPVRLLNPKTNKINACLNLEIRFGRASPPGIGTLLYNGEFLLILQILSIPCNSHANGMNIAPCLISALHLYSTPTRLIFSILSREAPKGRSKWLLFSAPNPASAR
jgi:hypothetical protein